MKYIGNHFQFSTNEIKSVALSLSLSVPLCLSVVPSKWRNYWLSPWQILMFTMHVNRVHSEDRFTVGVIVVKTIIDAKLFDISVCLMSLVRPHGKTEHRFESVEHPHSPLSILPLTRHDHDSGTTSACGRGTIVFFPLGLRPAPLPSRMKNANKSRVKIFVIETCDARRCESKAAWKNRTDFRCAIVD